jgi:hypothetical protein
MRVGGFIIPVSIDGFTIVAGIVALLAIAGFVSGVVNILRHRRLGLFRLTGSVILLLVGLAVFALAGWAQTYRALTVAQLIATIKAVPSTQTNQLMTIIYTPITNGQPGATQTFQVYGDQWQLGGDIIKWQDWVNILGVQTGYRVTRLMGYYNDATDYHSKRISAYNLDGGTDTLQQFIQDHPNLMPFVRATYGNDVRMQPDPTATYNVYVSTSGYWTARA